MMQKQTLPLPFDKTLTAENARQRGYEFACDLFGEFLAENRELVAALGPAGCVLGEASGENGALAFGLYQPLRRQAP